MPTVLLIPDRPSCRQGKSPDKIMTAAPRQQFSPSTSFAALIQWMKQFFFFLPFSLAKRADLEYNIVSVGGSLKHSAPLSDIERVGDGKTLKAAPPSL
jgi:hypothetical protein